MTELTVWSHRAVKNVWVVYDGQEVWAVAGLPGMWPYRRRFWKVPTWQPEPPEVVRKLAAVVGLPGVEPPSLSDELAICVEGCDCRRLSDLGVLN